MLLLCLQVNANKQGNIDSYSSLTVFLDSVPVITKADTINIAVDTLSHKSDSSKVKNTDSLHISKDSLDVPVKYSAQDSGVLDIAAKEFYLYGKSTATYKNINLTASVIKYNQQTQIIQAYGTLDTSNSTIGKPEFSQGDMKSVSDSLSFNMKTMKGLSRNTYYQEGELFINAQKLKKVSKDVFYAWNGSFTTCNYDTPHFAIRTRKMMMVNDHMAVSGPAFPEFEGVPVPLYVPFGIYPMVKGRHSGLLAPAFISSESYGMGIEGLGYYQVMNDYWDVLVKTNLYSYGGWALYVEPKYIKRYCYTGDLNVSFMSTKTLNESPTSLDEYLTSKTFMIYWSHQRDNRAHPGTTFNANVNFGSTRYNQLILNNPYQNYQNQLTSSVSFTENFNNKVNLSLNANHNQNNTTRLVNFNLPTVNLNVVTFYPFQKKEHVGTAKWYENLSIGYSTNVSNQFSYYDTAFSFKHLLDTMQWGATHNIPISVTLPKLGPLTFSPSVTYQERWYGQEITRSWDSALEKVDTSITKGFFTARQMSFGFATSTRVFGTYQFKNSRIVAIRHQITPTISLNYTPDMNSKFYYNSKVDTFGNVMRFSKFDGVMPGAFSEGTFGGISFSLDNTLEMKVKDKSDTSSGKATKKVKLIDGFGFSTSYNLLADSFALSPLSFYARSTLFKNVNVTANTVLDPYAVNQYGIRQNHLLWYASSPSLGRITSGSLALSTSFKSKPRDARSDSARLQNDPFMTPEEQQRQLQVARANPAQYTDFNIPWTLSLSYSLNFVRQINSDYSGYSTIVTSSVNFNGDFSLTPKLKMGATGYYDLTVLRLQQLSMFLSRDMHCWQLSVNVNPIGLYRSFSISLTPKAGILRDLHINRSRSFSNY